MNEIVVQLPETRKAIARNFSGKSNASLRKILYANACQCGSVLSASKRIALSV